MSKTNNNPNNLFFMMPSFFGLFYERMLTFIGYPAR